jgi:hypothetical protein
MGFLHRTPQALGLWEAILNERAKIIRIETAYVHCKQPLHIEIDSALNYTVREASAAPLIFVLTVDFNTLEDPSIIDAF